MKKKELISHIGFGALTGLAMTINPPLAVGIIGMKLWIEYDKYQYNKNIRKVWSFIAEERPDFIRDLANEYQNKNNK